MQAALRDLLIWSAVATSAAALNLATGTACGTRHPHVPREHNRRLTGPVAEVEPNDDDRTATDLVEARDESRTRFEGSCADGTRDVYRTSSGMSGHGVVVELRSGKGGPPPASLRAPESGLEASLRNGRIELRIAPGGAMGRVVYLEIPCADFRGEYSGYVTALDPRTLR